MAVWSKRFVAVVAGLLTLSLTISAAGQTGTTTFVSDSVSPTVAIASVVVAEAGPLKNGTLEANEPLEITWAAASQTGSITRQVLTLDGQQGQQFVAINGPYGGLYYYCLIGVIAAGHHTYTIQATDSNGTSSIAGSFDVAAAAGPTIANVIVAEATAPRDGNLASNEKLVITWAASSPSRVVSQTVQVDGSIVAPINGPYSGLYFSCQIGALSVGNHTYTIMATDSLGVISTSNGAFTVVAPSPARISDVVVTQATASQRSGNLQSNQKPRHYLGCNEPGPHCFPDCQRRWHGNEDDLRPL